MLFIKGCRGVNYESYLWLRWYVYIHALFKPSYYSLLNKNYLLVSQKNDHFVGIAEKGVDAFSDAQGFYVVNDVPWLQYLPSWLPGMNFLRIARQGYIDSMNMYRKPYEMVKENLVSSISFVFMTSCEFVLIRGL